MIYRVWTTVEYVQDVEAESEDAAMDKVSNRLEAQAFLYEVGYNINGLILGV